MKKSIIMFVKNGRKFNVRKKETKVEKFDVSVHEGSKVDRYGRVVHNMRFSECEIVMTAIEWRNKTNEVKNFFDFSGVYSSGVTADPSLIVEFAYDNGIDLGTSE